MSKLFNTTQAKEWMEGYPIGNGRLAAMVWGDDERDTLSLNHEWLWRGINRNQEIASASKHLHEVREIFKSGDCASGTKAAVKYFGSPKTNGTIDAYQPAGDLVFCPSHVGSFVERKLDLEHGVVTVKRSSLASEFYVDCIKDLIICEWSWDEPFGGLLFFDRCKDEGAQYKCEINGNTISFYCCFTGGLTYRVNVEFITDGKAITRDQGVYIESATFIRVKTDIGTEVKGIEEELAPKDYDFKEDKAKHLEKFASLMKRVSLQIEGSDSNDAYTIAERIERVRAGENDNGIAKIYFDYGRYLMLSCSIFAELPANLQGKWNDSIVPPWGSDYHFDINLQMCYWMCEAVDMPECVQVLIEYLMRFLETGRNAAQLHYGCRGILLPLSDDAWADSLPVSREYGIWIGAAAWMAQHIWWHYIYSGDKDFLRDTAYPFFKAVVEFYEDYLIEDENGELQVIPSQSPENRFEGATDYDVSLCVSAAMDIQLAFDALSYAISSAQILGVDNELQRKWQGMCHKLPPFKIGKDGRLLEWNEEKVEVEPGHRHLSHLYGVYPSDLFMQQRMTEQYEAAKKSLDFRLSHGGGHTGWSRAWVSCLYARFGNAEGFREHFQGLVKDFATVSLLDLHPPGIFQIDGNFGAVAAIVESIVSVYDKKIHLLKALPKEWESGSLSGIKVPGGHKLDVHWKDGAVTEVKFVHNRI